MYKGIRRNSEEREALAKERARLLAACNAEIDAADEIADNNAYDQRINEIHAAYDQRLATMAARIHALCFPEPRNEWFKGFADSFGVGEHRISDKQADVFFRYCDSIDGDTACRVNGRLYTVSASGHFLTVTDF